MCLVISTHWLIYSPTAVHLARGQPSTYPSPSFPSTSSVVNQSPMQRYLESARQYMRKGLASSTIKHWSTSALFCVSVSMPPKPVTINKICSCVSKNFISNHSTSMGWLPEVRSMSDFMILLYYYYVKSFMISQWPSDLIFCLLFYFCLFFANPLGMMS